MPKKSRSVPETQIRQVVLRRQYSGVDKPVLSDLSWPSFPSGTFESIIYGNSRVKRKGKYVYDRFNDCYHTKEKVFNTTSQYQSLQGSGSSYVYMSTDKAIPMHITDVNLVTSRDLTIPTEAMQTFVQDAFWGMKPRLDPGISVPNFIFELKDILPRALANLAKGTLENIRSSIFKTAAGTHLTSSFAIQPLISDIFALQEAKELFEGRLRDFLKKARKVHTSHYRKVVPGGDIPLVYHYRNSSISGESLISHGRINDTILVATMKYQYTTPGLQPLPPLLSKSQKRKLQKIYNKYMGWRIDKLPSIVWNAIPFSFVVDWIYKVGDYLESWDPGAVDTELTVIDFCVSSSMKYHLVGEHFMEGNKDSNFQATGYRARIDFWKQTYKRQRLVQYIGHPIVPRTMPVLDHFSGREQLLAVSLAVANKK